MILENIAAARVTMKRSPLRDGDAKAKAQYASTMAMIAIAEGVAQQVMGSGWDHNLAELEESMLVEQSSGMRTE